ncbi:MAG TPA: hypothetical protein VIK99_06920 [Thermaerobacter sp.]
MHPELSRAVCDDHSLGVPLKEAQGLSHDELWARVNAIRDRYLAQSKN